MLKVFFKGFRNILISHENRESHVFNDSAGRLWSFMVTVTQTSSGADGYFFLVPCLPLLCVCVLTHHSHLVTVAFTTGSEPKKEKRLNMFQYNVSHTPELPNHKLTYVEKNKPVLFLCDCVFYLSFI